MKKITKIVSLLCMAVLLPACGAKDNAVSGTQAMETQKIEETWETMETTEWVVETTEATSEATEPPTETTAEATESTLISSEAIPSETQASDVVSLEATESTEPTVKQIVEVPLKVGELQDLQYDDFVDVSLYIPEIYVDLRYAGTDNFTGECIYNFQEAYLRYGTVQKLEKVCQELEHYGLYLKIWDAFRPTSAQFKLWSIFPDPNYVADPNKGNSSHSRGNTVDVTLCDAQGNELEMPTGFDDFTDAANRDYSECTEEARKNVMLLESVMEKYGFHGYWGEWWHFAESTKFDVENVFDPNVISVWYPNCNEFITLRKRPSGYSDPLNTIPLGQPFRVLGYTGQFAMVDYMGQRGYVLTKYIKQNP